jgi:hypothetical protein
VVVYLLSLPKRYLFTRNEARHIARRVAKLLELFETGLVATEPVALLLFEPGRREAACFIAA